MLVLPPAPAALVLLGRAFAIFSFWSAAALRRMAVRAPPGAEGDEGRPMLAPVAAGELTGDDARGEDCWEDQRVLVSNAVLPSYAYSGELDGVVFGRGVGAPCCPLVVSRDTLPELDRGSFNCTYHLDVDLLGGQWGNIKKRTRR